MNGNVVDKPIYDKYKSAWKNMETCCPCILRSYDENDILLSEQVSCTDCGVGWFKEYYPNGNLRLTANIKKNPTGDWKNIWERKYCNIEIGQWDYFNENGKKIYSEFWKEVSL
jgi:antitoxin component YwqK of YwqJK toxin-antitoxin module